MELYGLVLTGGRSRRMMRDKALLRYHGVPHAKFLFELLSRNCTATFLSGRAGQWAGTELEELPLIPDLMEDRGPIGGILSAFARHGNANWLVLACDFPRLRAKTVEKLVGRFDPGSAATCYLSGGQPEPLCTVYTPAARTALEGAAAAGLGPLHALRSLPCRFVEPDTETDLANVNTPEEARLSGHGNSAQQGLGSKAEKP